MKTSVQIIIPTKVIRIIKKILCSKQEKETIKNILAIFNHNDFRLKLFTFSELLLIFFSHCSAIKFIGKSYKINLK